MDGTLACYVYLEGFKFKKESRRAETLHVSAFFGNGEREVGERDAYYNTFSQLIIFVL